MILLTPILNKNTMKVKLIKISYIQGRGTITRDIKVHAWKRILDTLCMYGFVLYFLITRCHKRCPVCVLYCPPLKIKTTGFGSEKIFGSAFHIRVKFRTGLWGSISRCVNKIHKLYKIQKLNLKVEIEERISKFNSTYNYVSFRSFLMKFKIWNSN